MALALSLALFFLAVAPLRPPRFERRLPVERREALVAGGVAAAAFAIGLAIHTVVLLAIVTALGLIAWRQSRAAAQRRQLRSLLPSIAEELAAAVRAGLPLPDAFAAIAAGQPTIVAAALREAAALMRLGRTLDEALVPLDALFGAHALLLRESLRAFHRRGGNVARALERVGALARAEVQLGDEVQALTAQGRASALVLALLAPCGLVFFLIANPSGAREFAADSRGQTLLSLALLLEAVGSLWLWRLVSR